MRWAVPLLCMLSACLERDTSKLGQADGWFDVGWGVDAFHPIASEVPIFLGPQGAWMFSLPLRGGGFDVPQPPSYDDPRTPRLDLAVEIDGFMAPLTAVEDLAIAFSPGAEPEIFEYRSAWLVIPDAIEPGDLVGRTGSIEAELRTGDGDALQREYDIVVGEPMN